MGVGLCAHSTPTKASHPRRGRGAVGKENPFRTKNSGTKMGLTRKRNAWHGHRRLWPRGNDTQRTDLADPIQKLAKHRPAAFRHPQLPRVTGAGRGWPRLPRRVECGFVRCAAGRGRGTTRGPRRLRQVTGRPQRCLGRAEERGGGGKRTRKQRETKIQRSNFHSFSRVLGFWLGGSGGNTYGMKQSPHTSVRGSGLEFCWGSVAFLLVWVGGMGRNKGR